MRFRPLCLSRSLPALFACGLAVTLGCAGAASSTGKAGSSGSGTAGTSAPARGHVRQPRARRAARARPAARAPSGSAGTTGSAGVDQPRRGRRRGRDQRRGRHRRQQLLRQQRNDRCRRRRRPAPRARPARRRHRRHLPDGDARIRAEDPDRLPGGRPVGQHVPLPHLEPAVCATKADTSWSQLKTAIADGAHAARRAGPLRVHDHLRNQSDRRRNVPAVINGTLADNVPPELDNAAEIKAKYDNLAWPLETESSTQRKEVRVAGDVRDHGDHQGAHGLHDARATST